jgi:hypothetical protein
VRNYGNIATAIWLDKDFTSLSCDAQRMYFMIITQNNITSVGTLPITLRRWASYANDLPSERLLNSLKELADGSYIAIDWEQEELLVRTFVKWDGGHTNPKRLLSIKASASAVTSPILAPILASELDALSVDHEILLPQVDSHSDAIESGKQWPRVVVTEVGTTPTHNPQQQSTLPDEAATPPEEIREDVEQICLLLSQRMVENGVKRPTITKEWRREARLMLDKDGYQLAQVIRVLEWSQQDAFWMGNIHSVPKLREKFGQLLIKAGAAGSPDPYRKHRMLG